jgi:hypothetical protein
LLNLRATDAPVPGPTPAIMAMSFEGMVVVGLVDVGNGDWGLEGRVDVVVVWVSRWVGGGEEEW